MHFNSQPHKEADGYLARVWEYCYDFNSQPHKEADICLRVIVFVLHISTHSLTRRLTSAGATDTNVGHISTHSLTRRLT